MGYLMLHNHIDNPVLNSLQLVKVYKIYTLWYTALVEMIKYRKIGPGYVM